MLRDKAAQWRHATVAERLEACRVMLVVHGYLRDSESRRIKDRIWRDWQREKEPQRPSPPEER